MKLDIYLKIVLTTIALCLIWICIKNIDFVSSVSAQTSVPKKEIAFYRLGWNQKKNIGEVRIKTTDDKVAKYDVKSAADLAGWAVILSQKPVYVNAEGWIYTGAEEAGQ